jgi:hypothetical protein
MATYEQAHLERIAAAIGVAVEQIARHENLFEEAARWYRLARRRPTRIAPSKMRDKLEEVAKNARSDFLKAWVSTVLLKHPTVPAAASFSLPWVVERAQ